MTDEKKTLKFQMMMSPTEAEQLDNWMFENRLRSRAEAIRRLCQIGLSAEDDLLLVQEMVDVVSRDFSNEFIETLLNHIGGTQDLKVLCDKFVAMNMKQVKKLLDLFKHNVDAAARIRQVSAINNTEDAIQLSADRHLETISKLEKLISELDGSADDGQLK